jgi:hypothetical protein
MAELMYETHPSLPYEALPDSNPAHLPRYEQMWWPSMRIFSALFPTKVPYVSERLKTRVVANAEKARLKGLIPVIFVIGAPGGFFIEDMRFIEEGILVEGV